MLPSFPSPSGLILERMYGELVVLGVLQVA